MIPDIKSKHIRIDTKRNGTQIFTPYCKRQDNRELLVYFINNMYQLKGAWEISVGNVQCTAADRGAATKILREAIINYEILQGQDIVKTDVIDLT